MAFDPISLLIEVLITLALEVVAYALMPKPKTAKPAEAADMDSPTADAGRPIPILFGTVTVKGLNILGWWDKSKNQYEVDA